MATPNFWQRTLAIAAVCLGAALVAAALVALPQTRTTSVGDVAAVEETLGDRSAMLDTNPPHGTESTPGAREERRNSLWHPNTTASTPITAARQPVRLEIETIDVSAPVVAYGVNRETGQMDVPNNVRDVAWYQYGPAPGENGSAVLAAHVDLSSEGPGVFYRLNDLLPGDMVGVDFDDGSTMTFVVAARATYAKEQLPLGEIFAEQGAAVLTLITCGGGFDSSRSRYDSNVVVYAYPVDSPDLGREGHAEGQLASDRLLN